MQRRRITMTFEALRDLIADTLGCDAEEINIDTHLMDDLEADSLDAVEINMAIEESIGVIIPDEAMAELKTVRDILSYLENAAE